VVLARQRVMAYAARRQPKTLPARDEWPDLSREYHDYRIPVPEFTAEQIEEVLHRVEKYSPEDELNCGACGYDSCREKAVAVLRGMAEATMCIPYMRSQAESLTSVVLEATPNAIVIVDSALRVQDVSPSAEQMFHCNRQTARGRPLREVIPMNDEFTAVRDSGQAVLNQIFRLRKDLIVEGGIVPIKKEGLIMAILRDVTEREQRLTEMEKFRSETLQRTQGVINQQMRVAHEIASLLGETTAETKVLLTQLARLMDQPKNEPNR